MLQRGRREGDVRRGRGGVKMVLRWGWGGWLEKLIHQVITGGGSCGISACPSVEEEENGERFPEDDWGSAVFPPSPTPSSPLDVPALLLLWQLTFWLLLLPHFPLLHYSVFHFICPLYYIFYLSPILNLSLSHKHTHHSPSPFWTLPSLSSFLHFSREAALDSQKSLACQKLLLTFQFSVFFSFTALCWCLIAGGHLHVNGPDKREA